MLLARDTIYIHDWWLSPGRLLLQTNTVSDFSTELQLRRPNKEKYRLDKLLERKAREGVKIYVIL